MGEVGVEREEGVVVLVDVAEGNPLDSEGEWEGGRGGMRG